jgi:hypothetical protein
MVYKYLTILNLTDSSLENIEVFKPVNIAFAVPYRPLRGNKFCSILQMVFIHSLLVQLDLAPWGLLVSRSCTLTMATGESFDGPL